MKAMTDLTGVLGGAAFAGAVRSLVAVADPLQLLALGEPTHGEPAFPALRNRIFEILAGQGFRSIAIESDRVAALRVDAYVRGGTGTLDAVLAEGFSHGMGRLAANRELVAWMRAYNDGRPPAGQLAFHGFDAPLEMTGAPSPRPFLEHLHGYLTAHLGPGPVRHRRTDLDRLLGDDGRWSDPAALMNAARSVGASSDAVALRAAADDLLTMLYAHAPGLVAASSRAEWQRAEVHATTALGLLRYHGQAAEPAPPAERTSRLLGVRDALMARNLLDIRTGEQHRGATLVFAHNRHVQRHAGTWRLADMDLLWSGAGSILAALLGDRYRVVIGSLGASTALGLAAPPPDTYEGALDAVTDGCALVDAARLRRDGSLRPRTDVTAEQGYFPLDATTLAHCEAVLHVARAPRQPRPADLPGPAPAELAGRIVALPDVTVVLAGPGSIAPRSSWGDRFFFAGAERHRPFATIVEHDTDGFDEDSRLHRPGAFRLNIELGRAEFTRRFGFAPADFAHHRAAIDFTRPDELLPHPLYAGQGWACVINPGPRVLPELDRLLAHAHRRAHDRHRRSLDRGQGR
jgi:erythromycin esterase-like protein